MIENRKNKQLKQTQPDKYMNKFYENKWQKANQQQVHNKQKTNEIK